jgi:hypothetical protein
MLLLKEISMKLYKRFVILMSGSLLFAFSYCTTNPRGDKVLETVDIESNINNFKEFSLSQQNAEIRYVIPKRINGHLLNNINSIDIKSGFILISDVDQCLLFDENGSFLRKIGIKGRGPNEYPYISSSSFGLNDNIILKVGENSFLEYRTNGTLVNSFIVKDLNLNQYIKSFILINDSIFFGFTPIPYIGKGGSKAVLYKKDGSIDRYFKNHRELNRSEPGFSSEDSRVSLTRYNNVLQFKEMMCDTLFILTEKFDLIPRFSFRIGKYSMPKDFKYLFSEIGADGYAPTHDYIFVNKIFETKNYLFIDCPFNKYMPARRITPRIIMGVEIWTNTLNILGIYNKKTKSLCFCTPTSTDNPLFTSGLYNDLDAGPRFYPQNQINDSTMVMWVDARQLKDHIASTEFRNATPLYLEKKLQLEALSDSLSEFDNPVLMFVTFKN